MAKKKYASATYPNQTTSLNHPAEEHHFHKDDQTDNLIKRHVEILAPTHNTHQLSSGKVGKPVVKDWIAGTGGHAPKPERYLMNFAFEESYDSSKCVNDFDPPLELRIPLAADEQGNGTKLVYWNGTQWVDVPDDWLTYVENKGKFVVQLKHWPDDPPSGMAP